MRRMKLQLKNWLSLNDIIKKKTSNDNMPNTLLLVIFFSLKFHGQIANYVANGGFEDHYNCNALYQISQANSWNAIDSVKLNHSFGYFHTCIGNIPSNAWAYQYPRTGNAYILGGFLNEGAPPPIIRNYAKNRLKSNLQAGKTYCVKFYVNIANDSQYGIDGFGAFFGPQNTDTIGQCALILSYINPQVQNPNGNVITDTLGWTLITGTFTAVGNEKYMVIGNFKTNLATNSASILPNPPANRYTDAIIDDVSCIEIDLPAYAGPNLAFIPGNTVYIGRPQDIGIDEACTWYNITNTNTAIGNAAGITVTPVATTTYVVKQDICGNIKWDTVVVYQSALGLGELKVINESVILWPSPASETLKINFELPGIAKEFTKAEIFNNIGQLLTKIELNYVEGKASIDLRELPDGVYLLNINGNNSQTVSRRFVITR